MGGRKESRRRRVRGGGAAMERSAFHPERGAGAAGQGRGGGEGRVPRMLRRRL